MESEKESVLCMDVEQSELEHIAGELRICYELSSYYVDITIMLDFQKRQHCYLDWITIRLDDLRRTNKDTK